MDKQLSDFEKWMKKNRAQLDDLVSLVDFAELKGVDRVTVYKYRKANIIKNEHILKLGKRQQFQFISWNQYKDLQFQPSKKPRRSRDDNQ